MVYPSPPFPAFQSCMNPGMGIGLWTRLGSGFKLIMISYLVCCVGEGVHVEYGDVSALQVLSESQPGLWRVLSTQGNVQYSNDQISLLTQSLCVSVCVRERGAWGREGGREGGRKKERDVASFPLTASTFSITFPGMIHFIFIDRSFDELTSPSLSTDSQVVCQSYLYSIEMIFRALLSCNRAILMLKRLQHVLENMLECS